jgi:hypothetical protein
LWHSHFVSIISFAIAKNIKTFLSDPHHTYCTSFTMPPQTEVALAVESITAFTDEQAVWSEMAALAWHNAISAESIFAETYEKTREQIVHGKHAMSCGALAPWTILTLHLSSYL